MKALMFMAGSVILKSDFCLGKFITHFGMAWWKLFSY